MALQQGQAVDRVLSVVQGLGRAVFAKAVAVGVERVFFLQVAAVGPQNFAQVARARAHMHPPRKTIALQLGHIATVIQVGVGQDDRVHAVRRDRQSVPVAQAQLLEALEQTAVHKQRLRAAANQVFGAGDAVSAADELKGHSHGVSVCPMACGVN